MHKIREGLPVTRNRKRNLLSLFNEWNSTVSFRAALDNRRLDDTGFLDGSEPGTSFGIGSCSVEESTQLGTVDDFLFHQVPGDRFQGHSPRLEDGAHLLGASSIILRTSLSMAQAVCSL